MFLTIPMFLTIVSDVSYFCVFFTNVSDVTIASDA
jgi:hypothetical protein